MVVKTKKQKESAAFNWQLKAGSCSAKFNPASYYYFVSSSVVHIPSLHTVAGAHCPFAWATVWMTRPWLLLPLSPKPKTNTEVSPRSQSAKCTGSSLKSSTVQYLAWFTLLICFVCRYKFTITYIMYYKKAEPSNIFLFYLSSPVFFFLSIHPSSHPR